MGTEPKNIDLSGFDETVNSQEKKGVDLSGFDAVVQKKSSVQTASKPVTTGGKAGSFVSQSDEEGSPYALGKDVVPVEKGPVVSKEKEPREALASEFNKFMAESLKPKALPSDKPAFVKNEAELTKIDTELKERKQQADKLNAFIQLNSDRFSDPEKREEYKSQLKERGYTDKEIGNAINIINSKVADKLNAFTQLNSDRFSDPEKKEEYKKELKRIGYTDNEIGNAINIINSEVDEKALAEAKKIEVEQIAKGSPYAPLDMAKKELTPAEVHNQIVERNISLGTSDFSDNQKELFKLNNEISALYKKSTRTPSDLMKIGELEKKRKQVDSEFKPLVNPLTDEPAGTVEEQQKANAFAQDVNTKAAGFKETYKGKLADVYHDLADKYKYWSNKYTKDVFMKAESIDPRIQNFPETIEAKRIQENYLGSKSDFFAIAQAYLLNKDVDIEKGLLHGTKVFTENLISQFVPEVLTNSKLLGNMPLDLSGRAYTDAFTKVMHDRQIPLTKEQKEAGKKTFGETVLGELGSLGGFILKLGVYKNLFGIVQEVSGLSRVIEALKNGDRFTKLGAGVLEMAVEEATMQSTGAGAGLGSGFWLSGKAMGKAGLKFKGKIGAIIQPFFDSIVRGSVGGTVGMESGAALSTTVDALMNDKDWKEELRKMYGDLSETGNRILSELVVNSIFGMVHVGKGAFTVDPKKLLKLSEELRSKGRIDAANSIQKKAEEIGRYKPMDTEEIDKFIADNKLTKQGKEGGKFPSLPKEPLFPEEAAPTMEWEGDQVKPKTTEDAVQKPSTEKEVPLTGETGQNIVPGGEGVGQAVKGTKTAEASKEKVDNNAKAVIDNITVEDHIASNPDLTDFGKENARKNPEEAIAKAKQNAQLAFDYLNGKISPAEYLIEKGFVKNYVEKESAEKLKNRADEESKFWADKINEQAEKTTTKAEAPQAVSVGVGGEVKVQDSEYKGVTGTTSVNVKEKDGIIKATFKGTRSDKPNATIGASGYRYGGKAVKETLSDFEKDYGVKVDEIIDGVDIAEITVLEERAEVNPRQGVGTGQSVTLRLIDTEGNIINDVNIVVNKRKFTEQPLKETPQAGSVGVGGDVKPTPQKIKVLGKDVNMYNDYIPSKVEDVEPNAMYSFNANSKNGIPSLLHDIAYANKREVNGVKSENWHASISGEELLKLYPKEPSLKEAPKTEKAGSVGVGGEVDLKGDIEGSTYILKNYKNAKKHPNLKVGDVVKVPIRDVMPAIGIELGNANAKPYTDAPISVNVLSDGTIRITDGHNRFKKALLNGDKDVEIKVVKIGGANVYDSWYNRMAIKAVKEGRITAKDAKSIIEKAGLEVPKEIVEQSLKETPKTEAPKTESVEALKNVESTTKALEDLKEEQPDSENIIYTIGSIGAGLKPSYINGRLMGALDKLGARRFASLYRKYVDYNLSKKYAVPRGKTFEQHLSYLVGDGDLFYEGIDEKYKNFLSASGFAVPEMTRQNALITNASRVSEAYHADKAAGKQTELTKAVEDLLGKKAEPSEKTPTVKTEAPKVLSKKVKPISELKVGDKFVLATDNGGTELTIVSNENGKVMFTEKGSTEKRSASEIQRQGNDLVILKSDWDKGVRPSEAEFRGGRFKKEVDPQELKDLTDKLSDVNYAEVKGTKAEKDEVYTKIAKRYLEGEERIIEVVNDRLGISEPEQKGTAKAEAKFTVDGEDYTPKTETSDVAKKAVEMYYDIKDAEGTTKARKAAKARREFLKENPSFKEIDDNISDIYKQLEQKGLLEKRGDCP